MSQYGEHEVLKDYFTKHGIEKGNLVDVGAFQKELSNTWSLLNDGWRGILIDATPMNAETLLTEFAGLDVKVVSVGVSDEKWIRPIHLHEHRGHNSLLEEWYPVNKLGRVVYISVLPLMNILKDMEVEKDFDLLSIDTEGMDFRILKCMFAMSDYRPKVVVTERESYEDEAEGVEFFGEYGYKLLMHTGPLENKYGNDIYTRL